MLPGPAGCITADGTSSGVAGACANAGPGLEGIYDPTVSPDGASVYLPGFDGQTLDIYRRETGPSCQAVSVSTASQSPATVSLRCQDRDGDPITTSIVTAPAHGTLGAIDQIGGTVPYTPQAGYSGTDSFSFAASDGTNSSSPTTVTITIAAPSAAQPSPAGPGPGGVGHPQATPPPVLTRLSQSSALWREVRSEPRHAPTTFSFSLNEAARVTLTFTRKVTGQRVNGASVTPRPTRRHASTCTRTVTLGTLSVQSGAGHHRIAFTGRLPGRGWLPRGRITVTAIASAHGHRSAARRLSFVIAR